MLNNRPNHVAIIMDGNGRWAKQQAKPRIIGHKQGVEIIQPIIKTAISQKIKVLSLFAFSCENWNRPKTEINFLMKLIASKLNQRTISTLNKNGVQFRWTGFTTNLPKTLLKKIMFLQATTEKNKKLILNLCFNYGGMQDITQAAVRFKHGESNDFAKLLLTKNLPNVDLLIRTGNEKRISNFMLFQLAYAEIIFESTYWPAYNEKKFLKNLSEYASRQRRFGTISEN